MFSLSKDQIDFETVKEFCQTENNGIKIWRHTMNMRLLNLIAILMLLVFGCINVYADDGFIVHTVYFQPSDAPDISVVKDKISNVVEAAQDLYANELDRHGFGRKTFEIEKTDDNLVIHHVTGEHQSTHYANNAYNKIKSLIPDSINFDTPNTGNQNDVHLIIVGGVELLNGTLWGYAWPHSDGVYGGYAVVSMDALNHSHNQGIRTVAHELGHAFGLNHKFACATCMMEAGGGGTRFTHNEARWLSNHYHFNNRPNDSVVIFIDHSKHTVKDLGNDIIRFELEVNSTIGLYQAEIINVSNNYVIMGWHYFDGDNVGTMIFDIERKFWGDNTALQLMDINGNWTYKDGIHVNMPPKMPENKNPNLTQSILDGSVVDETQSDKVVYLTIKSGGKNKPNHRGLHPINDPSEYMNGWRPERIRDDQNQYNESLIIHGVTFHRGFSLTPPDDEYYHSIIQYDLTNNPYIEFAGYVGISDHNDWHWQRNIHDNPNSCSVGGSCIFTFKIDDVVVYQSPIKNGKHDSDFVKFDIPLDASILEIAINATQDGNGCDAAIVADPKLFSDKPVDKDGAIAVNPVNKLTISWASVKSK